MASYETLGRMLYHWMSPQFCAFQFPVMCNNNMADVQICEAEVTILPFTLGSLHDIS